MSQQKGGLLETNQSYHYSRQKNDNYKNKSIDPNNFYQWHINNMYKSSYAHFHSKDSVQPKNTVIPGYGGFVPSIKADNIHAKVFSQMAKESFSGEKLGKNILGLATTGFNVNRQAFLDQSKLASSSKYGKSILQRAHPNWREGQWTSTTHNFHRNPQDQLNPTFRQTDKWLQTTKPETKGSGFSTNHAYFDGTGWNPHAILKGDNKRTEYRDRFNPKQQFHRDTFTTKQRLLPHQEMNYKYN